MIFNDTTETGIEVFSIPQDVRNDEENRPYDWQSTAEREEKRAA